MSYKINDIDFSMFGITPIRGNEPVALTGFLDFPGREGTTERDWGTETEAFVSAADLEWKERKLTFTGLVEAASSAALLQSIADFSALCKNNLLTLQTTYGTFGVVLKDELTVTRLDDVTATVKADFTEQNVVFPALVLAATGGAGYRLSGYNLQNDFGIYVEKSSGQLDTPSRIEVKTTADYLKTSYRKPKDITLKCAMLQQDILSLISKMGQFHSLLASEGLKAFIDRDDQTYNVYAKDGFSTVIKGLSEVVATFTLKLRVL